MPENSADLSIVMTLVDEATAKLKEAMGEINKDADTSKEKNKQNNDETKKGFDEAAKSVRAFKRDLLLVAGAVTAVYTSVKTYARYNAEARQSVTEFETSLEKLKVTAGKALLPVLKLLNQSAKGWQMIFNVITTGDIGNTALDNQVTSLMQANSSLDEYNQKLKDIELLYRSGGISTQEYYNFIMSSESQVMAVRDMSMAQMQELANLQIMIGNQDLMEAQRITSEKIALLQFYQQEYNTAHQGMAAFTVMLGQAIQTNLSGAIVDIIMRTKTAKQAFAELGQAMIKSILDFIVQKMVAWAIEKTLLAGTVASAAASGAAVAAAWAPAALAANIASFGGAAAAAAATFPVAAASMTASMALTSAAGSATRTVSVDSEMIGGGNVLAGFGGAQADGGDYMVRRPTLFLAGEAGPERATFTPIGRDMPAQQSSRQIYIDINIDHPTVSKESDIDYLVETVSKRLSQEVERIR